MTMFRVIEAEIDEVEVALVAGSFEAAIFSHGIGPWTLLVIEVTGEIEGDAVGEIVTTGEFVELEEAKQRLGKLLGNNFTA